MSEQANRPSVAALENALAALTPAAGPLDRDQLMFRAGQASLRPRPWLWPAATAALAVLAVGLGSTLALRLAEPSPGPAAKIRIVERIVYVKVKEAVPAPPTAIKEQPGPTLIEPSASAGDELPSQVASDRQLQKQLLRWGLDGLPGLPPPAASGRPERVDRLLDRPGIGPVTSLWSSPTIVTKPRGTS